MALSLDNNHFKAYYNRAFCYDKLGKEDLAEKDYKKAVALNPNNLSALHHLATIQERLGGNRLEQALDNFSKCIEIDQTYAPSYNGRGLVWD